MIRQLVHFFPMIKFDMVFFDHEKKEYYNDLKLLEEHLLSQQHVLIADNVIVFKINDYYDYIIDNPKYKTVIYDTNLEYNDNHDTQIYKDGIIISVAKN